MGSEVVDGERRKKKRRRHPSVDYGKGGDRPSRPLLGLRRRGKRKGKEEGGENAFGLSRVLQEKKKYARDGGKEKSPGIVVAGRGGEKEGALA